MTWLESERRKPGSRDREVRTSEWHDDSASPSPRKEGRKEGSWKRWSVECKRREQEWEQCERCDGHNQLPRRKHWVISEGKLHMTLWTSSSYHPTKAPKSTARFITNPLHLAQAQTLRLCDELKAYRRTPNRKTTNRKPFTYLHQTFPQTNSQTITRDHALQVDSCKERTSQGYSVRKTPRWRRSQRFSPKPKKLLSPPGSSLHQTRRPRAQKNAWKCFVFKETGLGSCASGHTGLQTATTDTNHKRARTRSQAAMAGGEEIQWEASEARNNTIYRFPRFLAPERSQHVQKD